MPNERMPTLFFMPRMTLQLYRNASPRLPFPVRACVASSAAAFASRNSRASVPGAGLHSLPLAQQGEQQATALESNQKEIAMTVTFTPRNETPAAWRDAELTMAAFESLAISQHGICRCGPARRSAHGVAGRQLGPRHRHIGFSPGAVGCTPAWYGLSVSVLPFSGRRRPGADSGRPGA
jgi:hypothetical protein